jgi:hypothetical protein
LFFDKPANFDFSNDHYEYNLVEPSSLNLDETEILEQEFKDFIPTKDNPNYKTYTSSELQSKYRKSSSNDKMMSFLKFSDFVTFISYSEDDINLNFYENQLKEEELDNKSMGKIINIDSIPIRCNSTKTYLLKIPKKSVKYTKGFYVDSDITVSLITRKICSSKVKELIAESQKQVSFSLVSLYILNHLKLHFVNILNSKEMVDIVLLDDLDLNEHVEQVYSIFDPLSCEIYYEYYSQWSSFESNLYTRSFFYDTEGRLA